MTPARLTGPNTKGISMPLRPLYPLAFLLAALTLCHRTAYAANTPPNTPDRTVEYYALLANGQKIGHAIVKRHHHNNQITSTQHATFTISRLATPLTITLTETHVETPDGKPLRFKTLQQVSNNAVHTQGLFKNNALHTKTANGLTQHTKTIPWPKNARMLEGLRLLQQQKGLKPGTTYHYQIFNGADLSFMAAQTRVEKPQTVDLLGRVLRLHHLRTTYQLGTGQLLEHAWIDDNANTLKSRFTVMGIQLDMVACDKTFALSDDQTVDFFKKWTIPAPQAFDPDTPHTIRYTLQTQASRPCPLPTTDRQTLKIIDNNHARLTVRPASDPHTATLPYKGQDPRAQAALKPSQYIQSDHPDIINLATTVIGQNKDTASAAKRIARFVAQYIRKKNLSVGYASALEVLHNKQGDCTEHAVLTAALCQAAGIPAELVIGLVYYQTSPQDPPCFAPHAWTQVYVAGQWLEIDATRPQGVSAAHIAFANGNDGPLHFWAALDAIGLLKITQLQIQPPHEDTQGPGPISSPKIPPKNKTRPLAAPPRP